MCNRSMIPQLQTGSLVLVGLLDTSAATRDLHPDALMTVQTFTGVGLMAP